MSIKQVNSLVDRASKRRKMQHESSSDDEDVASPNESSLSDEVDENVAGHDDGQSDDDSKDDEASEDESNDEIQSEPQVNHNGPRTIPGQSNSTPKSSLRNMSQNVQVQHLLQSIDLSSSQQLKKLAPVISRLTKAINETPLVSKLTFEQAKTYAKKSLNVSIPWSPEPLGEIQYSFAFSTPSHIVSRITASTTGDGVHLELAPQIPDELLQEKDYLNYRALHKRSFYLACIAAAMRKQVQGIELQYDYLDDNEFLPILLCSIPAEKSSPAMTVSINPCLPPSQRPIEKILPSSNCLRGAKIDAPTPFYNSSIRSLSTHSTYDDLLKRTKDKAEAFEDVCALGRTWLSKRGFSSSRHVGGFGAAEWGVICALFLESGGHNNQALFSNRYNAIQLFKAMLQVLATRDFLKPLVIRGNTKIESEAGLPTLFDAQTGVNILYKMSAISYSRLRRYAEHSLSLLNSKVPESFESTFVSSVSDPLLENDEVYVVKIPLNGIRGRDTRYAALARIEKMLERGLGDRVQSIRLNLQPLASTSVISWSQSYSDVSVHIGILINAETTVRTVDKGPSVENKDESAAYRAFWGEKAELRKFTDVGIVESLIWSTEESVTKQIIQHLFSRHCKVSSPNFQTLPTILSQQLPEDESIPASAAFQLANAQFQKLSDTLRNLDGLPLQVRSINPASAALRSASTNLPASPEKVEPIDVVVELDTSGRWPEDLSAINFTKLAFLTKIGDLLAEADTSISPRVGIENSTSTDQGNFNTAFLDLEYPASTPLVSPLVFRLRLLHTPIESLLQQRLTSPSLRGPERALLQHSLQTHRQLFHATPAHTTAIRNLTTKFPSLSPTIRLLKHWLSCHNLSNLLAAELAELLATHTFISPTPYPSAPGTASTAFLRALRHLSTWDWTTTPLLLDLSLSQDALTPSAVTDFHTRFAAWRKMDPAMNTVTYFIGTSIDPTGVIWSQGTRARPEKIIAGRIRALAAAAVSSITTTQNPWMVDAQTLRGLFVPDLSHYDFVLHLHPRSVLVAGGRDGKQARDRKFKNLALQAGTVDTTGFDIPRAYLEDLETCFGDVALFFYGDSDARVTAKKRKEGPTICGLWRPHVKGSKRLGIRLAFSSVPVVGGDERVGDCIFNEDATLAEIALLGEGMIKKVVRRGDVQE